MSKRTPQKVVSSRTSQLGALSLISLLLLVGTCLVGSAEARSSRALNNEQVMEELRQKYENEFYRVTHENNETPMVGQGDTYEDFWKPEEPFSSTENYLKMNSFLIGMKLTDTYGDNTDLCINDLVDAIDAQAYFNNNITVHRKEM